MYPHAARILLTRIAGAASTEEEVAWDEDSDSDGPATPNNKNNPASNSTTTLTKNTDAACSSTAP